MEFRGYEVKGISGRNMMRCFEDIRTDFEIDIKYDKGKAGYYIDEQNSSEKASEFERFIDSIHVFRAMNSAIKVPDCIYAEKYSYTGSEHLQPIIRAIEDLKQIEFYYQKFGSEEYSRRIVKPYAIREYKKRWYLIGTSGSEAHLKSYGLDRIKTLNVSISGFKKNLNLKVPELFQHSFGIYSSTQYPLEDIILSYDAADGNYLKSTPLHSSQEELINTDDEFRIKLHLRITPDFIMELLSRTWSLKIVAPDSLRLQIQKICKDAFERNS